MSPVVNPSPWLKRLAAAEKRGFFTETEKKLAGNWPSCGIGERHKLLTGKRLKDGSNWIGNKDDYSIYERLTPMAARLGWDFVDAVEDNDVKSARSTFKQIQRLTKTTQLTREKMY